MWNETNLNFQNYFKAKFIEVFVVGIFGSLMFWLLGVNSPVLLGVTFGLSQLIPFFGPVFMTFPVLIVSLAQFGLDPYVLFILFCYAMLQNIDGNIFLPFLMSGVVKLPAVVVLLSVFFFGAPKKNTERRTTTAGSLTTPDIRNGRKIFPSMFCNIA